MVAVLRGGVGGFALALCLSGLADPPRGDFELAEDERRLTAAHVGTRAGELIDFLRRQVLQPEHVASAKDLIGQLRHDNFRVRENTAARLVQLGPGVVPLLKHAKAHGDLETQRRADRCLQAIAQANSPEIVASAIRLLVHHRTSGIASALLDFLPFAANDDIAEQTADAILTLGLSDPSASASLEAALQSKYAERRAVAGRVLALTGSVYQVQRAKNLLKDDEPLVRLRVAQGLVARGDREGVPVLIALISGPAGAEAADVLAGLAGETAPAIVWANAAESRWHSQIAWRGWWQQNEKQLAFAPGAVKPQGPAARARDAAQRFVSALGHGDFAAFKRTVDIPFFLGGLVTFTAADDFDQLFRQVVEGQKNDKKELSFRILGSGSFPEFQKDLGEVDLENLKTLDSRKVHVVFVQGRIAGEPFERGVVLVRLTPARALVIGIYQSRSP